MVLGKLHHRAGLQIADALNLTTASLSSIGGLAEQFCYGRLKKVASVGAIASCVPPEAQLAIVALGTALTAIAIPAMYAAGAGKPLL